MKTGVGTPHARCSDDLFAEYSDKSPFHDAGRAPLFHLLASGHLRQKPVAGLHSWGLFLGGSARQLYGVDSLNIPGFFVQMSKLMNVCGVRRR